MKKEKETLNIENLKGYVLVSITRNGKLLSRRIVKAGDKNRTTRSL